MHEAFGYEYQLPNATAYNETCANIAHAMWNWRLLNLSGDARYADVMERVLYNSMLSSMSLDGITFLLYQSACAGMAQSIALLSQDSYRSLVHFTLLLLSYQYRPHHRPAAQLGLQPIRPSHMDPSL